MKLHNYPETDSLSIELTDAPGMKAREIVEGLVADFDAAGEGAEGGHRHCRALTGRAILTPGVGQPESFGIKACLLLAACRR